ncbi:MAG TPA: hypothetical protein VGW10_08200 [Solirubrobacteraceae bacterium]|nr:hypothetical protein [Solirubrobacteraceae bacterium]
MAGRILIPGVVGLLMTAGGPATPADDRTFVYDGTLTTAVRHFSPCGGTPVDTRTRMAATLVVGAPVSDAPLEPYFPPAAGADGNPIRLQLGQAGVQGNLAHGSLFLRSAQRFGATSPPLVLKYWQLALAGAHLTGTLVDDHTEEAAGHNLLGADVELVACLPHFGVIPWQHAIAEGARLGGTLTPARVDFVVQGATVDRARQFGAQFVGTAR